MWNNPTFNYDQAMSDPTSPIFTNIHTKEWIEEEKQAYDPENIEEEDNDTKDV